MYGSVTSQEDNVKEKQQPLKWLSKPCYPNEGTGETANMSN